MKKGSKSSLTYEVYIEGSDFIPSFILRRARDTINNRLQPPIDRYYLIEEHHPLGGGFSGGEEYSRLVGIAYGQRELPEKMYSLAVREARKLARKLKYKFVDKTPHKKRFGLESMIGSLPQGVGDFTSP